MFSKACEYGIKSMIYIAWKSRQQGRAGLNDIAAEIDSPVSFTAKILQKLVKSGLLHSIKGPTGGFEISEEQAAVIRLSQIVTAIDGNQVYMGCGLGFNNCSDLKPCPVHLKFKLVRTELREMLEETTLAGLTNDINSGLSFLKRS
jgi:Rrf2 family protein